MHRPALLAASLFVVSLGIGGDRAASAHWFNPGIGFGMGSTGGFGLRGMGYGGLGYGMGYGMGYGGYGMGGTVGGSYMQGMSQIIRAKGEYNEQTSKAMINYEDARTKYIDNRKKWTETYFAMKEQNSARAAERLAKSRPSAEAITQAARSGVARPLSTEAFDPLTGKVNWPDLLLADEYAKPRGELDQLLELHTTTSGGDGSAARVQQLVQQMTSTLKSNIQNLPTNEYISARKFLDSLAVSARS
ncbi:MAG: hypothetical protein ACKV0T_27105 [Planctomycetales bacterium]